MKSSDILLELYEVVRDRKLNPKPGSYTSKLMSGGLNSILKKIGEETAELIAAAKGGPDRELIHEVADVLYHVMVLLAYRDIHINNVLKELELRRK